QVAVVSTYVGWISCFTALFSLG
ncbi:MAG: hypothetical protein QOE40_1520, partial [Actinomycetota bacterium]|nr:hypothetical protein [Actinomycetota bacterium]